MPKIHKVVIIGSGPAGYTAAIYTSRALLSPLLITGDLVGGQLMTTTDIENFPGYLNNISGPKMMEDLHHQAQQFGTIFKTSTVNRITTSEKPFKILTADGEQLFTESIIIATGAKALWLNAEGEYPLRSNGISTCATCDGAFFKDEELLVIGAGDSAMEEAIFLTRYASKVTIIHRRDQFRASNIMIERAKQNDKIDWKLNCTVMKWLTDEEGELCGALLKNTKDSSTEEISCGGAFIAIGHKPASVFLEGQLKTDEDGYILHVKNTMTSVEGIFCCGDVCASSRRYRQAITAAGEGCQAAMDCEKWLEDHNTI